MKSTVTSSDFENIEIWDSEETSLEKSNKNKPFLEYASFIFGHICTLNSKVYSTRGTCIFPFPSNPLGIVG